MDSPFKKQIFCVHEGQYTGEFLAYMEDLNDRVVVLALPNKIIRRIPLQDWEDGLESGVIEMLETLPDEVYGVLRTEYERELK